MGYDARSFFTAYVEAALWSSMDESDENTGGSPLDANYDASDIADETLATMRADCEKFQADNADLLARYYDELPRTEWSPQAQAGHDFWLSRNGHGAGFFDREASREVRDALQSIAEKWGEVALYIGDDGKIYA